MSSTGPPGAARPASVIGGSACGPKQGLPGPGWLQAPVLPVWSVTVASANGPAAALTWGSRPVEEGSAAVARAGSIVAVTSAPRCAENAWSNGALESTASARPTTDAPVDPSRTRQITNAWTRLRPSAARSARHTGPAAVMAEPAPLCHRPQCHRPLCHRPLCHRPPCHRPPCHRPAGRLRRDGRWLPGRR